VETVLEGSSTRTSSGYKFHSLAGSSGVQAIGQEGDEDMRFDPGLVLMEDQPDGEVALKFGEELTPTRVLGGGLILAGILTQLG
jgi:hypothetical protein